MLTLPAGLLNEAAPWLPDQELQKRAAAFALDGREHLLEKRVVVCGLARNLGPLLPQNLACLENLENLCLQLAFVLVENDSEDHTRASIGAWGLARQGRRLHLLGEQFHDPRWPNTRDLHRAAAMAYYRDLYWQEVEKRYSHWDYVIVADLDLLQPWHMRGLFNTFGQHAAWDAVGANGMRLHRGQWVHYDVWAFRKMGHPQPHHRTEINPLRFKNGEPLFPVESCFGGLAVYRMPAFLAGQYAGGDCEHVAFHRTLRAAGFGRTFLNPCQVIVN